MDPITSNIIMSFCTSFLANYSTDAVKNFFGKAIELKPELEQKVQLAKNLQDVEAIFDEATGVINAYAGDGALNIDGGLLEALRGIRFDHARGIVTIDNTAVSAPVIQYGGRTNSSGQTTITNTHSTTGGTSIKVSGGSKIIISGNSKIIQS